MAETLLSVGLDVGTTSTQMVVSQLQVENRASGFAVPELEITDKTVCYRSPVYFTPLLSGERIDGQRLKALVEEEYRRAGICREAVQTGAIIITGETSRKENARTVLENLSHLAGDFVVATAGPDLESRLAAKGSGAVERSARTGQTVLHMDIGGGTSNLALIRNGEILDTGCLNVGGRLVRFHEAGKVTYVSPVLQNLTDLQPGQILRQDRARELSEKLAQVLEMAAGLRKREPILNQMVTREGKLPEESLYPEKLVFSFSGGVADCIAEDRPFGAFGDMGPELGRAIRESRLCRGDYFLGRETIRATVIGAGCHSTQLSGSTVFYQNVDFPLGNLPSALVRDGPEPLCQRIQTAIFRQEDRPVLVLPKVETPDYDTVRHMAEEIGKAVDGGPCYLCLGQDMAKALGQALALILPEGQPILCLDRICLGEDSYLDVGAPVGPAVPVVVKTLILGKQQ